MAGHNNIMIFSLETIMMYRWYRAYISLIFSCQGLVMTRVAFLLLVNPLATLAFSNSTQCTLWFMTHVSHRANCQFWLLITAVTNRAAVTDIAVLAATKWTQKKERIVLREIHLRTTGRHLSIRSHSVICHPTEVTAPPSPQPGRLVLDLSTP